MIRAQYLGAGCYRNVYDLVDDWTGESTGRVLKVDNHQTLNRHRTFHVHHMSGCNDEAAVYETVKERAPHLLHHLATVYAHGPGWLVQEKALLPCGLRSLAFRPILEQFKADAGVRITDIGQYNIGRRPRNDKPIIIDYACSAVEGLHEDSDLLPAGQSIR